MPAKRAEKCAENKRNRKCSNGVNKKIEQILTFCYALKGVENLTFVRFPPVGPGKGRTTVTNNRQLTTNLIGYKLLVTKGMKYDKKWLAEWLMNKLGTTKKAAQEAVDGMFDEVAKAMVKGEQVKVAGFGVFKVSRRAAREGINPRTGEKIQIPAKVAPKFRAAKQLKEMVG